MNKIKGLLREVLYFSLKKTGFLTLYWEAKYRLGFFKQHLETDLKEAIDDFINVNTPLWTKKSNLDGRVLVEGHLSEYGINYLFRTAVTALALQEEKNLEIDVIYNGYSHQWAIPCKVYKSFGITNHIYLNTYFLFLNIKFRFLAMLVASHYKKTVRTPDDILNIKFGNIPVGDLIYDDILKLNNLKTITAIDEKVIAAIRKSYYYYVQYKQLFKRKKYQYYISTHSAYSEYGLLCRVALMFDVPVIETTDIQTNFYERIRDNELPTYHQGIKNLVNKLYKKTDLHSEEQIAIAKAALHERIDSKIPQIDIQRAYRGKEYFREDLAESLGFNKDKKIGFILTHIFSDSPHTSSKMLYADYYVWLEKTIEICSNVSDVNWVVKPHPASSLYGEDGIVGKMISGLSGNNIVLCPDDFNTKSIKNCADVIVTVHGTAGLEFACFGIPVILAGKPFYSEMGFTIEPETISEYEAALKSVNSVKLSTEQINTAFRILSIWNTQFDWFNPIITTEVLANVWGSETKRDLPKAYKIVSENLKLNDPRELKLWNVSKRYVNESYAL